MSWMKTTPEDMARRKGVSDARAGKAEKPDIHWPRELREAYRVSYQRTRTAMEKS